MSEWITLEQIDQARDVVAGKIHIQPKIGLILGSGLGELAEQVENSDVIPYNQLPHWPQPTIQGHKGRLVVGTLEKQPILVMQGARTIMKVRPWGKVLFLFG